MKQMEKKHIIRIGTGLAILLVLGGVYGAVSYLSEIRADIRALRDDLESAKSSFAETDLALVAELSALAEENKSLASSQSKIQSESAARLAELSRQVSSTQSGLDLTSVITAWRPYIAQVRCRFITPRTAINTSGSAILARTANDDYAHLLTSRHVVYYQATEPEECEVTFPDIGETVDVTPNFLFYEKKGLDFARIDIGGRVDAVDLLSNLTVNRNVCSSASVGERVVVIGYPSIGAKDDVTATEGIISARDGDYYITSAKIDQGSSGGAAILVRASGETCYLGIPTFVNVGQAEALARILSAKVVLER